MLLTALYIAQEQDGYLTEGAIRRIAERMQMPIADVYSAASFYSLFRTKQEGRYVIQVCEGLSCHLTDGADSLVEHIQRKLGVQVGETTPDGLFTLRVAECLASCGTAPTLRVNDEIYESMTLAKVDRLLDHLAER
jgi:NADH-quinone oxidoreductase subunit E